jgi:hypothetical protein
VVCGVWCVVCAWGVSVVCGVCVRSLRKCWYAAVGVCL